MLVRILGLIDANMKKYSDSEEKMRLKPKLKDSYKFYLNLFAKMVKNIRFDELHRLLGFHLKIFQQYFLVNFEDDKHTMFKNIYFQLFSRILGDCENGLLLV